MDWFNNFIHRKLSKRRMEKNYTGVPQPHLPWWEELNDKVNRSRLVGIILLLILWAFCSTIMIIPKLRPQLHSLQLHHKTAKTVYAKLDFDYRDNRKTDELKKAAADKIPEYFKISTQRNEEIIKNVNGILLLLSARAGNIEDNKSAVAEFSGHKFVADIPEQSLRDFERRLADKEWRENFDKVFKATLNKGIRPLVSATVENSPGIRLIDDFGRETLTRSDDNIPVPKVAAAQIVGAVLKSEPETADREIWRNVLQNILEIAIGNEGNLTPQVAYREKLQKKASASVKPVTVEIKKNYPIILRGESVSPRHIDIVEAHDLAYNQQAQESGSYRQMIYHLFRCFLLILLMGLYLCYIHPEVVKSNRKIMICTIIAIAGILTNYGALVVFHMAGEIWTISPLLTNEALPLALCSILLTVIIGLRVALYLGFFVSAMTTMVVDNNFDLLLSGMIVCCVSSMAVRNSNNYRAFFVRSLFSVTISVAVIGCCMDFIANEMPMEALAIMWLVAFMNGLLTAVMAMVLLFALEMGFNVNTNMSLLMCDYNHPLLVELRKKAPGTFHHSLTVSTLVEAAAKAIKYNPIPGRVAALFHDIGKISKPEYFAENIPAENKHDELRPHMSTMVIMNHVKAGMLMAAKYKLPDIVRKAIEQHHGTDMVYYFYRKAIDGNKERNTVEEQEFRYPGPLPSEKSVVLVCLADACEAACRSIQKPTAAKIEQMVNDIFQRRIRDGQLDEAEITVGELSLVRDSLTRELISIHHARMAYPKTEGNFENKPFMETKKTAASEPGTISKDGQTRS